MWLKCEEDKCVNSDHLASVEMCKDVDNSWKVAAYEPQQMVQYVFGKFGSEMDAMKRYKEIVALLEVKGK